MDFDLTEEQRLLKESVDGLLTDGYDFDQRKKYMAEKGGWSKAIWGKLAEHEDRRAFEKMHADNGRVGFNTPNSIGQGNGGGTHIAHTRSLISDCHCPRKLAIQ